MNESDGPIITPVHGPIDRDNECAITINEGSGPDDIASVVTPAFPTVCEYVRFVVGEMEVGYWDRQEWVDDPMDVMGAIFGLMNELYIGKVMTVSYTKHHRDEPEGHIFIEKEGACTITLTGAAAMPQEELDKYGKIMADALKKALNDELT